MHFSSFEMQVKLGHILENMFGIFFVGGGVGGKDKEVIHVNDKPSFSNYVMKGVIHKSLVSGR